MMRIPQAYTLMKTVCAIFAILMIHYVNNIRLEKKANAISKKWLIVSELRERVKNMTV